MISLLIPHRGGCPHRERNLRHVLAYYRERLPACEILLIEQETHTATPDGVKRIAVDRTGGFNRGACINAGARACEGGHLLVLDNDLLLDPAVLSRLEPVDFFAPFGFLNKLTEAQTEEWLRGGARDAWGELTLTEYPFGAAAFLMNRQTFLSVGGFEEFEGWGWEDFAFAAKVRTLLGRRPRAHEPAVHLWHPTGGNTEWIASDLFQRNQAHAQALEWMTREEIEEYVAGKDLREPKAFPKAIGRFAAI